MQVAPQTTFSQGGSRGPLRPFVIGLGGRARENRQMPSQSVGNAALRTGLRRIKSE